MPKFTVVITQPIAVDVETISCNEAVRIARQRLDDFLSSNISAQPDISYQGDGYIFEH